jgi:orotate phosphoribosyltransferase
MLAKKLVEIGAVRKGKFKLSSGKISDLYIDLRILPSYPNIFRLALNLLYTHNWSIIHSAGAIVGVATGGIVWATGLSLISGKPMGYVRVEKKEHGRGRNIELDIETGNIIVVDDVSTTGGSLEKAISILRDSNYSVSNAVVLVDRREGAQEILARIGVRLSSVITIDLIRRYLEEKT